MTQLYYENIKIGDQIPPLEKHPTTQQLVMYAGASGDYYQIHYDASFAKEKGFPGVIVHGALKNAFLGQLMTDWIGNPGILLELSVRYRDIDIPNDILTCKGSVKEKSHQGGESRVICDIWIEDGEGNITTTGSATISIPMRAT